MKTRNYDVIIDSQSAIKKIEPFMKLSVKGVNFVVQDPNLEIKVIEALEQFSANFRVQIVVKDKGIIEKINDLGRWMLSGGVIGFALYVLVPWTPSLGTCVLGGIALGALHANFKIRLGRNFDGQMVLTTV